jgi:hypothetical protein
MSAQGGGARAIVSVACIKRPFSERLDAEVSVSYSTAGGQFSD